MSMRLKIRSGLAQVCGASDERGDLLAPGAGADARREPLQRRGGAFAILSALKVSKTLGRLGVSRILSVKRFLSVERVLRVEPGEERARAITYPLARARPK